MRFSEGERPARTALIALFGLLSSTAIHQLLGNKLECCPGAASAPQSRHVLERVGSPILLRGKTNACSLNRASNHDALAFDFRRPTSRSTAKSHARSATCAQCCKADPCAALQMPLCAVRQALPRTPYFQSATDAPSPRHQAVDRSELSKPGRNDNRGQAPARRVSLQPASTACALNGVTSIPSRAAKTILNCKKATNVRWG